jgi:hypothetical protein
MRKYLLLAVAVWSLGSPAPIQAQTAPGVIEYATADG